MEERAVPPFDPLDYANIAKSVVDALLEQAPRPLKGIEPFGGAGVYALYYVGSFPGYEQIAEPPYRVPIYVGKAVPPGARKGSDRPAPEVGQALYRRLKEHARSVDEASNLDLGDVSCRYLRVQHVWIPLAEQVLVQRSRPLWNTVIDGFGNHPPGRGRRSMRRPRWDIVHPGRACALELAAQERTDDILSEVRVHLARRS